MNTKYCPKCGKELPSESEFCPYCMTKFIETKTKKVSFEKNKKPVLLIIIITLSVLIIAGIILALFFFPSFSNKTDLQDSSVPVTSTYENKESTDGKSSDTLSGSTRCYFEGFSIEVPNDWIYEEDGDTVTFYEKYNYEHKETGSTGYIFSIVRTKGFDDFPSAKFLGSKNGYNYYRETPLGIGIKEDEVAEEKYTYAVSIMDIVLDTFEIE